MKWIKINESAKNDEKIINKIKTLIDSLDDINLATSIRDLIIKSNQSANVTTDNSNEWFGGIKGAVYVDTDELGRDFEEWGAIKYKGKLIEVSDIEDELGMEYDDIQGDEGDIYHTYFLDWVENDLDKTRLKKLLTKLAR